MDKELVISGQMDLSDWAVPFRGYFISGMLALQFGPFIVYFEVRDVE